MNTSSQPITVSVTRDVVESQHLVDCVVIGPEGPLLVAGELDRNVIARSALKPIQVLPLVETGAADHYELSDDEIALGASSHSAEQAHLDAVDAWLGRIGLNREALECGTARPLSVRRADELVGEGTTFEPIHNCCSGKHAGFLTIAKHLGEQTQGYIDREHPVQQLVTDAIGRYTGIDMSSRSSGLDGCGIPTFSLPLQALATAMCNLVTSDDPAAMRVTGALTRAAFWLSGPDRHECRVEMAAKEPLLLKQGAEGVFMGALPTRGYGFAVKARDGALRASSTAVSRVLDELGAVDTAPLATQITNAEGTVVGTMEAKIP